MRRTHVYFTEKQVERLHLVASQEGVAMAEVIRRAVEVYLYGAIPRTPRLSPLQKARPVHPPDEARGLSWLAFCNYSIPCLRDSSLPHPLYHLL
jgi:hypothetical protein